MLCDAATLLLSPFFNGMLNMASTWHFQSWQLIDAKTLALATASSPVCNMARYGCCKYISYTSKQFIWKQKHRFPMHWVWWANDALLHILLPL